MTKPQPYIETAATKPLIVLISGKQGSGKTTFSANLASRLFENNPLEQTYISKIAAPLYALQDNVLQYLFSDAPDQQPAKIGSVLQYIGELGRDLRGDSYWAEQSVNTVLSLATDDSCLSYVLIDDLRHKSEIEAYKRFIQKEGKFNLLTVRIDVAEYVRKRRTDSWRDNVDHISEIDLDGYQSWDLQVDATHLNETQVLEYIYAHPQFRIERVRPVLPNKRPDIIDQMR